MRTLSGYRHEIQHYPSRFARCLGLSGQVVAAALGVLAIAKFTGVL